MHPFVVIGQQEQGGNQFAQACAAALQAPVQNFTVHYFANSETTIVVQDGEQLRDAHVVVVYLFSVSCGAVNEQIVELLQLLDTIQRHCPQRVDLIVPYLPYSRQDVDGQLAAGQINRIAWLERLFILHGVTKCYTLDLHNPGAVKGLCIESIAMTDWWAACIKERYQAELAQHVLVLVAVDEGIRARVTALAERLALPVVCMAKQRAHGRVAVSSSSVQEVAGKHAVLIDDILDSGSTILAAVELLAAHNVQAVSACITHMVGANSACKVLLDRYNLKLYATNSLVQPMSAGYETLQIETMLAACVAKKLINKGL